MRLTTTILLAALATAGCNRNPLPTDPADRIIATACEYLWSMQQDDGAWRSETHGLMKGGESTTAFVLHALVSSPDSLCDAEPGKLERGLDFLREHVGEDGRVGVSDPDILDYPNYATSYTLLTLAKTDDDQDVNRIARMRDYLVAQQFDELRGIPFSHPAYGGWGFGETVLPEGGIGHVDLSHTRRVLQGLHAADHPNQDTYNQAIVFLRLHQKHPADQRLSGIDIDSTVYDGGFFASAAVPTVNKSDLVMQSGDIYLFQSYATATADGLLALLSASHQRGDESVESAIEWLLENDGLSRPAGIPRDQPAQWDRVMFFYHLMVRGEAYRAVGHGGPWRSEMAELLIDRQYEDGSFYNPYGAPNKEDDPLLATAMVLRALKR